LAFSTISREEARISKTQENVRSDESIGRRTQPWTVAIKEEKHSRTGDQTESGLVRKGDGS